MAPGHCVDKQQEYSQCERCGRIKVDDEWLLPLEAIVKGIKLDLIKSFTNEICPECNSKITIAILNNIVPLTT